MWATHLRAALDDTCRVCAVCKGREDASRSPRALASLEPTASLLEVGKLDWVERLADRPGVAKNGNHPWAPAGSRHLLPTQANQRGNATPLRGAHKAMPGGALREGVPLGAPRSAGMFSRALAHTSKEAKA